MNKCCDYRQLSTEQILNSIFRDFVIRSLFKDVKKCHSLIQYLCSNKVISKELIAKNVPYLSMMCGVFLKKWRNWTSGGQISGRTKKNIRRRWTASYRGVSKKYFGGKKYSKDLKQELKHASGPSVDPSAVHWCLIRNGLHGDHSHGRCIWTWIWRSMNLSRSHS